MKSITRLLSDDIFGVDRRSSNLSTKAVRGGVIAGGEQALKFFLSLIGTAILARILTPADYGLIAMVSIFIGFAAMLVNGGLDLATIQRPTITHRQISALFWLNSLIGLTLCLCVLCIAPLVALAYGEPKLSALTAALSFPLLLNGLTVQHAALLRRNMLFAEIAFIQISSRTVGLITSITLALCSWGYWSLVAGLWITPLATLALTFYFCPWCPSLYRKDSRALGMMKFGAQFTAANLIGFLSRTADNFLIGRFVGAEGLGLYTRAYGIFVQPICQIRAPIQNAAYAPLSLLKENPERFQKYFYNIAIVVSFLAVPIAVYFLVQPDFVIRILLGTQWMSAAPILQVLSVAGILQSFSGLSGLVMMSYGYTKRYLVLSIFSGLSVITSFLIGVPYGAIGVAIAYTTVDLLIIIPKLSYAFKNTPIRTLNFISCLILPLASAGVAIGVAIWVTATAGLPEVQTEWLFLALYLPTYVLVSLLPPSTRDLVRLVISRLLGKDRDF